jgi:chromosome segregation ATPase
MGKSISQHKIEKSVILEHKISMSSSTTAAKLEALNEQYESALQEQEKMQALSDEEKDKTKTIFQGLNKIQMKIHQFETAIEALEKTRKFMIEQPTTTSEALMEHEKKIEIQKQLLVEERRERRRWLERREDNYDRTATYSRKLREAQKTVEKAEKEMKNLVDEK